MVVVKDIDGGFTEENPFQFIHILGDHPCSNF